MKVAAGHLSTLLVTAMVALVFAQPSAAGLVISQIYGGGGNAGSTYTNDYIEIFNNDPFAVNLSGLSLQYASATGTGLFGAASNFITPLPNFLLQPGEYFLVEEDQGAGGTTPLPSPDLTDATPINMSATAGKVVLVNGVTGLGCNGGSTPCSAAQLARIIDLVGYGNANFFEGAGAAPTLTNTTADFRRLGGLQDTNNNAADFTAGAPNPRNTAFPAVSVPEPATLALLGIGVAGIAASRRRKLQ